MRGGIAAVLAAAAVSVLAAGASGSTSSSPLNTVLRGAWFQVAMHGRYSMSWSGQRTEGCGPTDQESFSGSVSQTITFGTRRRARRWAFSVTVFDRQFHRRVTYLLFSSRYLAPGTKVGPNAFAGAKLATPALFTRSATGTYTPCGSPPVQIQNIPCPTVAVPSFHAVAEWSPYRPSGRHAPAFNTEETANRSPYPGKCAQEDNDYESLLGQAGVPNLEQDHLDPVMAAPGIARFMNARVGTTITTRFNGNPFGWSPSYSQLSVKLTFRRVR
jgi:hypothetical protein